MKKIVLLAVLACGLACGAQDTVHYCDPYYHFFPLDFNYSYTLEDGGGAACVQMYVPEGVDSIYGVAAVFSLRGFDTNTRYTVVLYGKQDDRQFCIIDSLNWAGRPEGVYVEYKYSRFGYPYFDTEVVDTVLVGKEFYFDSVHVVTDTVFYGVFETARTVYSMSASFSQVVTSSVDAVGPGHKWLYFPTRILNYAECFTLGTGQNEPRVATWGNWGGVFAITKPRCIPPRGAHVAEYGADNAVVAWEGRDSSLYQLAVGLYNWPVDSAVAVYTTADTSFVVDSLLQGVNYAAWLRRRCIVCGDTVWGPWSTKVHLRLPLGVDEVASGVDFTLSPNPARGNVRLACREVMLGVVVVDVAGRTVAETKPRGTDAVVDISDLPTGVYTVRVTTAQGTATRRLAVGR